MISKVITLVGLMLLSQTSLAFDLSDFGKLGEQLKEVQKTAKYMRGEVSEEEERGMGNQIAATLLAAAPPVKNRALQRYVNQVGMWIAQQSERPQLPWTFAVLDTNTVNAFAAPGGYVFITKPLFLLLQNESELATVLGHEIAHVVEKHHVKELKKQTGINVLLKGALKAGKKNLSSSKDKENLDKLLGASKQLYSKGLSRGDEHDADKRGIVLAALAGYNPYAFMDVLTTLSEISPDDKSLALMTNTHPPTATRLAHIDQVIDSGLLAYSDKPLLEKRFQKHKASLLK